MEALSGRQKNIGQYESPVRLAQAQQKFAPEMVLLLIKRPYALGI